MLKRTIFMLLLLVFFCRVSRAADRSGEIININYDYEIAFTDLSSNYLKVKDVVKIIKNGKFVTYLQVSQTSPAISRLIPIKNESQYKTEIDFKNISVGSTVIKVGQDNTRAQQPLKPSVPDKFDAQLPGKAAGGNTEITLSAAEISNKDNILSLNDKVKVLSDNYVRLSKSLTDLLDEKKQIETELLKTREDQKSLILKNNALETKNAALQNELDTLRSQENTDKCKNLKKEIVGLKNVINALKEKLLNINNLLHEEGKK